MANQVEPSVKPRVEDALLVEKAQADNQDSYAELIRRYARLVWVTIYGIVHDPVWTEDLVQETFIRGWEMINTLRDPSSFRSWLLMIARRKALQHNETLTRQGQIMEDLASRPTGRGSPQWATRPAVEESDAGDLPDRQAGLREQLHSVLRRLPDRYKVPITLRYLEGFNYNKIAEVLGLTDGSLRGLLNRGMKRLREELKPIKDKED